MKFEDGKRPVDLRALFVDKTPQIRLSATNAIDLANSYMIRSFPPFQRQKYLIGQRMCELRTTI